MNRFQIGDIVVHENERRFPKSIYLRISDIIEPDMFFHEQYCFGQEYDISSDKLILDQCKCPIMHEFWAHEVNYVDMKGANI